MFLVRRVIADELGNGVRVAFNPISGDLRSRATRYNTPYKEGFLSANLWKSDTGNNHILVEDWVDRRKYTIFLNGSCSTDPIEVDGHPTPKYATEELTDLFKYLIQSNPWMSDELRQETFERIVNPIELVRESPQTLFSVLEHGKVGYLSIVKDNGEVIMRSTSSERVSLFPLTSRFLTTINWYMRNL